ncbi:hypothetical protein [Enterococcus phage MDA2]|uniref:Uncharacterized protein n=1 Tax=Enterococcus phage MDA2 TaxID=2816459 RepID=A0AAE7RFH3_9CAUD|nr:hypothetical protein [Enterococcus phage MDA2]
MLVSILNTLFHLFYLSYKYRIPKFLFFVNRKD